MDDEVRWPSRHYLASPVLSDVGAGNTVLLGCTCGVWECWPFTAVVTVADDTVTWSGYRGPRDWDYHELWNMTFGRRQYEDALRTTARPVVSLATPAPGPAQGGRTVNAARRPRVRRAKSAAMTRMLHPPRIVSKRDLAGWRLG